MLSAEHIFPVGVPGAKRDEAIAALNLAGIGVTVNYRSVPGTTYYAARYPGVDERCHVSQRWGLETLTLPLYPSMTAAEQDHVIRVLLEQVYPLVSI